MSFAELGLSSAVMEGVKAMGYVEPTPIQLCAIPKILAGKDVIGSAQTGTGKTAAFALPILSKLEKPAPGPRVLVLEPTRELAAQVETSFRDFSRFTQLRSVVVFGGVGYGKQTDMLRSGVDILIATPGRLIDYLQRGTVRLDQVQHLVLDEADRMLDMGFLPDVRRIIERCPKQRQTCLFSATVPPDIDALIKWSMNKPEIIEIGARRSPATTVKHAIFPVADGQKTDLLQALLDQINYDSVIIFCRTRHRADRIAKFLSKNRHAVATLHSDRSQRQREDALKGFRDKRYDVLVATDIAARGIDVPEVSHVINFDVPLHAEDYVHRIGRTGRAQATGDAFTIMIAEERGQVRDIEKFIGQKIVRERLENFPYNASPAFDELRPGETIKPKPRQQQQRQQQRPQHQPHPQNRPPQQRPPQGQPQSQQGQPQRPPQQHQQHQPQRPPQQRPQHPRPAQPQQHGQGPRPPRPQHQQPRHNQPNRGPRPQEPREPREVDGNREGANERPPIHKWLANRPDTSVSKIYGGPLPSQSKGRRGKHRSGGGGGNRRFGGGGGYGGSKSLPPGRSW
ncbi:MAG TPA: DEAD/DEAH box helicase [Verrucomicrobiae bacterium]